MAGVSGSRASFDFCHNPHAGSLLQSLQELRSDNKLLDVTLCVAGKEIPCHRNVLAACSGYFCAMFCNGHRETKEYKVTINEVDSNALQLLVDYAYTSKVTITEHNAVELLEGANFFQIQPVRDACVTFISNNLSAENCLQILHVGNMLSCQDLENKARLCALKEFVAISKTPEFLSLTKDRLITLISSDDLNASEETVYTAVMAWINHDTRRRKEMKELIELVRFPFMDKMYFLENVESNNTVRKTCHDIVLETRKYQLFPGEIQSPRTRPRRATGLKEAVVIIGGLEKNGEERPVYSHSITMTDSMEPSSSSWVPMTRIDHKTCSSCVTVLGTSDILVSLDKEVWLYQPELNSWSQLAQMNSDRYFHGLAVLQGKVYAIGGKLYKSKMLPALSSVEVYDRRQHKWTEGVPLPQPRLGHAIAVLDDYIYVMGGVDSEKKQTSTVYRFSPGDSQWQPQRNMPEAAEGIITAAVLNDSIYVAEIDVTNMCQ
uniref:BTB domain-containing protein n=1 Tax=Branchiostoma floridae TaxID=7739 RepID=C3XRJ1_BRAFL|eukprot:XP_002613300.1 hypothetical protein BRAFLDRAFT_113785 [Branchiostoma floridae]